MVDPAVALQEARERTLAIVAPLSREDMERVHDPLMSPLVWDLAHIAAYEDLWIGHRLGSQELLRPELAAMYDAFETPRAVRGDLPLLDLDGALEYLADVRERTEATLEGEHELVELVLRHEQQHNETMLQAIELAGLRSAPGMPRAERPAGAGLTGLERVEVPAGPCVIGAPDDGFAYDNERPWHEREVAAFAIGRVPVTNRLYVPFVEAGEVDPPQGWVRNGSGWLQQRVDGIRPLDLDEPVVHVSFHEAETFARAHGARLPTEFEWEKAARGADREHANLDHGGFGPAPAGGYPEGAAQSGALGMLGDVWEWTSSRFDPYHGFAAHPYREYSEVFFGSEYRVLRGGSWATRTNVASPTFRNWDLPQRRQIFSGLRLAWDA